jgi:hypothetical protein
MIFERED